MRAKEFLLLEYNQAATAERFGDKILQNVLKDPSPEIANIYHLLHDRKEFKDFNLNPQQKTNILISIMQAIEACDPTKNKEYTVFLAKMYAQGGWGAKIEDLESKIKPALTKFHTLKLKKKLPSPRNDIMRYADLADFVAVMDEYEDPGEKKGLEKGDAYTAFENDQVRIVVPNDQAAACYYGQGTRWCTASTQGTNYFNHYHKDGQMYILLPKQPKHAGEKYQLHFPSEQFMDEEDRPVENIVNLLEHRFGNLVPFFKEEMPEYYINEWIMFADDEDLKEPLMQIGEIIMEHVWEMVNDWEHNDDYWYDWLRKEGYVYPEGHEEAGMIDWDKAAEDDVDYLSWNYDANDWYLAAKDAVEMSPTMARRAAEETYQEEGEILTLGELELLPAYNVRQAFERSRDGDGGLEEWIGKHIIMQRDGSKWEAKYYNPKKPTTT
jgi:hypothetical protein